jgi:hypothetical protein
MYLCYDYCHSGNLTKERYFNEWLESHPYNTALVLFFWPAALYGIVHTHRRIKVQRLVQELVDPTPEGSVRVYNEFIDGFFDEKAPPKSFRLTYTLESGVQVTVDSKG